MTVYGYCRVSTEGQADNNSLEAQEAELRAEGATVIYKDVCSGAKMHRPQFDELMSKIQEGDRLIVTKLDRFARTATEGFNMIQKLFDRGIRVQVLNVGTIENTTTGRLILHIFLAFAEFERETIKERMSEGKAVARQKPGYREGRPKKYTKRQLDHALSLLSEHSYKQVAELTGISKSTLIRTKKGRN